MQPDQELPVGASVDADCGSAESDDGHSLNSGVGTLSDQLSYPGSPSTSKDKTAVLQQLNKLIVFGSHTLYTADHC